MTGADFVLGVDVGGTFTDAVLADRTRAWWAKAPTTTADVTDGVVDACRRVADGAGLSLEALLPRVARFGLGTTAVTNALASRRGRVVGLITTRGFEDLLPLARGRLVVADGWLAPPEPLVPRRRIVGVDERVDRDGIVLRPLSADEVVAAGRRLVDDEGVEAVAVSFLWSFVNPTHELAAVDVLEAALPGVPVVAGSAVHPVIREYERTTAAVLNAYTGAAFAGIERLAGDLAELGLSVPLLLVHSAGGAMSAEAARVTPIALAESGPAAGVLAATAVARGAGAAGVVTFDMGGTSVDVSIVENGEPARRARGELMGCWTALPRVDVESIGAGGGSIAWVDARGMLQVGPGSAGSHPGPASYGRGGTEATITDALVVLGYLDPERFLGGEMPLDADAARTACAALGRALGLDTVETAWGIREVALAGMVRMVRARLAREGLDPRQLALVAYGGGGGLFAADVARAARIPRVISPELAPVLSALGAATGAVRRERVRSLSLPLPVDPDVVAKVSAELAALAASDLAADGVVEADGVVSLEADLRFKRQTAELTVPLDDDLAAAFRAAYARRYGEGALARGAPIELVTLRAIGTGPAVGAPASATRAGHEPSASWPDTRRPVQVDRRGDACVVAVRDLSTLDDGAAVEGPVLLDGRDTTVWVPPGARARRGESGTLVVEVVDG